MLMPDDRSNILSSDEGFPYDEVDDHGNELSIDLGALLDLLEESAEPSQARPEDLSTNLMQGLSASECAETSVAFEDAKLESKWPLASPVHSSSGSLIDWISVQDGHLGVDKDTVSGNASSSSIHDIKYIKHEIPDRGQTFCFPAGIYNYHSADISEKQFENENSSRALQAAPKVEEYSGLEIGLSNDRFPGYGYPSSPGVSDMVDPSSSSASDQFNSFNFDLYSMADDTRKMTSAKEEMEMSYDVSTEDLADQGLSHPFLGGDHDSVNYRVPTFSNGNFLMKQETHLSHKQEENLTHNDAMDIKFFGDVAGQSPGVSSSSSVTLGLCRKSEVLAVENMCKLPEYKRPRLSLDDYDETASGVGMWNIRPLAVSVTNTSNQQINCTNLNGVGGPVLNRVGGPVLNPISAPVLNPIGSPVLNPIGAPILPMFNGSHIANMNGQNMWSDSYIQNCDSDDDGDLCVLEEISGPPQLKIFSPLINGKSPIASRSAVICSSLQATSVGQIKHKANGENRIFQAVLQDLYQQQSEDSPPEGLMAVPLLKHQRIALSWMVRKENAVSCSGGILADDQGLGKTVSTIALILKERSPTSLELNRKENEPETLNLDDDDDDDNNDSLSKVGCLNQGDESAQVDGHVGGRSTSPQSKRRPAAGTLIVCPTSVLRQWSEELQNKVTSKANLSVLLYHGSNRTKDPHELAKYDVVLTTYAIVSMEVAKRPTVDEDDDDAKGTSDFPVELSSFKNRKYPPHSSKKSSKSKKKVEVDLQDIRPLAGVGWFRVILDEAQSIKNHRTQVARACWALRAKRRWCLSGTPMQNAVDDLYSYFRFLKFDPYSGYKSFCSDIKAPIQRSPVTGYKRLQAVLKTIMLRRTKGSLIDGEPIINLPPKTIKLHKVDFSPEEREFYQTLESDSRAQYAEYAAAGTVQKNYVNILLMLLRLRQACDHPLLVKGFGSNSKSISSIETVKKIPPEKQLHLLQRYEASLSICRICRDPPEDSVITSCGHIFCNQCISEHLSGDDTHCPAANCKTHLKGVAVFSVAALRCSLSDQPAPDCPHPKQEQMSELLCPGSAYDSSKIRAALEVLQSLNKQHDYSRTSSPSFVDVRTPTAEDASGRHSMGVNESGCDVENKGRGEPSRCSVGEKAIVFSQWTRMLDLLEECLKDSGIQYRRLDGTMSVVARDKAVKDFNTRPEVSVMIMSLKAASLGLNMVAACYVLLLDLWWNPTTEDQAIDRAHRIGQTRPVTVLRLTVKDTVEDRILALQVLINTV
ncbi:OLC1v1021621C2 [Oldenlandia corymbosa var. corymbosa]|uniref:OLC1v1021621C2 n=1 Tax=Oldenlandia corymbosa var. corymbosa TaxID=529605 RepID=A0AAV1BYP6_OLDCO|nr:OLC1v1021621C2 [Oldenlandia corymbosa var. corymbosa]